MRHLFILLALIGLVAGSALAQTDHPLEIVKFNARLRTDQQKPGAPMLVENSRTDTSQVYETSWLHPDTVFAYYFATAADSLHGAVKIQFGKGGVWLPVSHTDSVKRFGTADHVMDTKADSLVAGHAMWFRKPANCNQVRFIIAFAASGNAADNNDGGRLEKYPYQLGILQNKVRK